MSAEVKKYNIVKLVILFLQGMIMGVGAVLPGVSGGVLCVAFGIYAPMMELLAHPRTGLKKYWKGAIPIIAGFAAGFVLLAGIVAKLAAKQATVVTCLFIGLIIGTFPKLYKDSAKQGRNKACWAALGISTAVLLVFFYSLKNGVGASLTPSIGWFFFCGVLWGISLVVPGMSSSSVLILLGLYYPMSAGIAALDPKVVIPFIIGIAVTVVLLARGVDMLFNKHYAVAYHCIIGFVIASTIPIIPTAFASTREVIFSIACAIVGFIGAYYMSKLDAGED